MIHDITKDQIGTLEQQRTKVKVSKAVMGEFWDALFKYERMDLLERIVGLGSKNDFISSCKCSWNDFFYKDEVLKVVDEINDWYALLMLTPFVWTSDGKSNTGVKRVFDPYKIVTSLIKETGLVRNIAYKVAEGTTRKIIEGRVAFLSTPHIREMVCSELAFMGLNDERKLYTRIGMD